MSDGIAADAANGAESTEGPTRGRGSMLEVLAVAARLGLTSFGGPVAHLGYFREEYVRRRKWISEDAYADLVALCQFLPGPTSSQVGIAIGILRAGLPGAVASWLGFTLPSAIVLVAFAFGDRKSTRLNSSHPSISYAVFCLKKKKKYHSECHSHFLKTTNPRESR